MAAERRWGKETKKSDICIPFERVMSVDHPLWNGVAGGLDQGFEDPRARKA
jgi:hypothetical protein